MRRAFGRSGGLYTDLGKAHAHAWPLSQALAASLEVGSLGPSAPSAAGLDAGRTIRALASYRSGSAYSSVAEPPVDKGGTRFFDDNEWIALDLLAGYQRHHDGALLARAARLFAFVASGWDWNRGDRCPGGVFWADTPTIRDRNTVSTANGALVALGLYQETHAHNYLVWARRMYGWVSRCLADSNGMFFDHLDAAGRVVTDEWTYNQGAMITAGVLLAQATGEPRYLDNAQACARAALAHYRRSDYAGEPAVFVAIFFRDLQTLAQVRPGPLYRTALVDYARGHVRLDRRGRYGATLLDQAAAAQLYALAADAL